MNMDHDAVLANFSEQLDTRNMIWNKDNRSLLLAFDPEGFHRSFPRSVTVKSHRTGRVVEFIYDSKTAERHEFWDGEKAEYIPARHEGIAVRLIIYPAY